MAEEISITGRLNILNGTYRADFNPGTIKADLASNLSESGVVASTGTAAAIDTSNVATYGLCYLRNVTLTDNILIGREDGGTFRELITLLPGEFALFRLSTANIYHKRSGSEDTLLQYFVQSA